MSSKKNTVYGIDLNAHTGCKHYSSSLDIIAMRFKCCQKYFACYFCHQELADHIPEKWHLEDFEIQAVLCGSCKSKLTISQYLLCAFCCPYCKAKFNPKCKKHWGFYFAFESCFYGDSVVKKNLLKKVVSFEIF